MPKTDLVNRLRTDFPQFSLVEGDDFFWSPKKQTVFFRPLKTAEDSMVLLHEMSHAVLGHTQFKQDLHLLKIEREAWQYASSTLSPKYRVSIDNDFVEDSLESYREWLHNRSRCPTCALTGVQKKSGTYACLSCGLSWTVNDARRTGLRRRAITH